MPAATGDHRRPMSSHVEMTAIVVATSDTTPAQLSSVVAACRAEISEVLVAAVDGSPEFPDDGLVAVVAGHDDVERALRAAAQLATTSRCLIVDPTRRWVPGSAAGHAAHTGDVVSTVSPPVPAADRHGPCPARASIGRRCGLAIPTSRLASAASDLSFADVAVALRSLEQLRDDGVEFVELPYSAAPDDDVVQAGIEAVRLYRAAPHTMAATGLGAYRTVSYPVFVRRRLSSLRPQWLGRGGRSPGPGDAEFWQGVRNESSPTEWAGLTAATPILMYHGFADHEPGSRYVVTRRHLRRQLRLLKLLRRQTMSLDDYVAVRRAHGLVAPRSVVVTIDDGYADAFSVAAPEFRRAGIVATLFVPTAHVGTRCDWTTEPALAGRPIATWTQMESALDTIAIGSHARHHVALDELDDTDVVAELAGSADDVLAALGRPATTFAYPFGAENAQTRRHVEASAYLAGCTSRGGRNSVTEPLHSLRRVEIRGDASLWAFAVALATGSSLPLRTQLRGGT